MRHSRILVIVALVGAMLAATAINAAAWTYVFPVGTNPGMQFANGEAFQITFGPNGAISTVMDPNINTTTYAGTTDAYFGDDMAVAFINNSGASIASVILGPSSGNGGGLFAFENSYSAAYPGSTTDDNYGGGAAVITFSGINFAQDTGTVNFTGGLLDGTAAYFVFESAPNSLNNNPYVPIPPSALLFGSGLLGLVGWRRFRKG